MCYVYVYEEQSQTIDVLAEFFQQIELINLSVTE